MKSLTEAVPRGEDSRAQAGVVVGVGEGGEVVLQPSVAQVERQQAPAGPQQQQQQDGHHHHRHVLRRALHPHRLGPWETGGQRSAHTSLVSSQ